jgi:hypothetical protein
MDVCPRLSVLLSCVGKSLCDGLITRPEESYRVSKYIMNPPVWGGQGLTKTVGSLMNEWIVTRQDAIVMVCVVIPCSLVDGYQRFEGTCCLNIQFYSEYECNPEDNNLNSHRRENFKILHERSLSKRYLHR